MTIVTQTRVARQEESSPDGRKRSARAVAEFPGFIEQTVMPPNPPAQIDWVILQRFASLEAAVAG